MDRGLLTFCTPLQIPEHFGAVRAIAEGPGSELLVGTTKNALLRGDLAQGFSPVIQVGGQGFWGAGREELWGGAEMTAVLRCRVTRMSSGGSAHIPSRTVSSPVAMTASSASGTGRAMPLPGASTSR